MEVLRNGKFSFVFTQDQLTRGIRSEKNSRRNAGSFSTVQGMIGKDGALESLPNLSSIDTSVITDGFPYPQLFVFTKHILVYGETEIYEYDSVGGLTLKYTANAGSTWKAVDFFDYIVMSNEKDVIVRDPDSTNYSADSSLDVFAAICNYNGQVMIGAPGVGTS